MGVPYRTLISPEDLRPHLYQPDWVIMDCRFSLQDPPAGRRAYLESHIPGAVYAHLDKDLSGPVVRGKTGRHPLPDLQTFAATAAGWGVQVGSQVVAYDSSGGSMAARLWWLLRWAGHDQTAVLDGGWQAWVDAGLPVTDEATRPHARVFIPQPRPNLAVDAAAVARLVSRNEPAGPFLLMDARSAERFRGENEAIDPVAGHIPGAISMPYSENLGTDGRFKKADELRARFAGRMGPVPANQVVCYCGSGVTAAHNLLAIAHAGLGDALLYPGSWSEWITEPTRPVER